MASHIDHFFNFHLTRLKKNVHMTIRYGRDKSKLAKFIFKLNNFNKNKNPKIKNKLHHLP